MLQFCLEMLQLKATTCHWDISSNHIQIREEDVIVLAAPFLYTLLGRSLKDAGIHFICDVCPICRKGIETAIKSLANIANQSLRQQQNGTATEVSSDGDGDDEALTSTVDGNVEQVQNLTLQIMALTVASPPAQPLSPARVNVVSTPRPSTRRRPPHCSTCGHLKQGHQRPVAQGTPSKCPLCPSQSCMREGPMLSCQCHWCSRQSQTNSNQSMSSLSQGPIIRETHISPDLTEWLLSFSQSTVTPGQIGSNACTIISV
ncbi:PREDICTED: uncharacterized protein LOC107353723 isoform X2 [Acropora digitifera]|uniref:uncharacterized protein LOC107353723 isoform X2 n=1 Tax=Acropora digitifera TaxID=70779 RepID=UPI00077A2AA7|nr:PREDICTED: uncharacterized protein LOC107353723 isoform X2 [Acropora digitifera]